MSALEAENADLKERLLVTEEAAQFAGDATERLRRAARDADKKAKTASPKDTAQAALPTVTATPQLMAKKKGSICQHGRRRSHCKECGGGNICQHGRIRSQCNECGEDAICQHERQRSRCKECGGRGICQHGRRRSRYKECGGSGIHEHGRNKSICRALKCVAESGSWCTHGELRAVCKQCGGGSICQHGRARVKCLQCITAPKKVTAAPLP